MLILLPERKSGPHHCETNENEVLREDLQEGKEATLKKCSEGHCRLHLTHPAQGSKATHLPKTVPKGFTYRSLRVVKLKSTDSMCSTAPFL